MSDARTLYRADTPRKCGSCTTCCTLLPVAELDKPRGVRCKHLKFGQRCTIYAARPESCRMFQCRWLMQPELLPLGWLRPDHCHVVFDPSPDHVTIECGDERRNIDVQQLWVDPAYPNAHRDPRVRHVIETIAERNGIPTIARIGMRGVGIFAPCLSNPREWHEKDAILGPERIWEDETLQMQARGLHATYTE